MSAPGTLIVGGGIASQRCAETLRARGYDGRIRIVCGESEAPYDRPPLSKSALAGELDFDELRFRDGRWYRENQVELLLGERAAGLDPRARSVPLESGATLRYETLVIPTGAAPRRLRMLEGYSNVYYLRTATEARALRQALDDGARLVVIGAGFIGQEVAATAVGTGAQVAIVEALDLPLGGALGERVSRWLVDLHKGAAVRVLLSARVEGARGNGRVEELNLHGGGRLPADAVLVGVGVRATTNWLAGTDLAGEGIPTDAAGRTAIPGVYAAGDVARPYDGRAGRHVRTEHWDAASRQGSAVARAILGSAPREAPLPSFWSDQYGSRIQYVGYASGADAVEISGDPASRDFTALYRRRGRPVAALTVDRPRELAALRRLINRASQSKEVPT